MAANNKSVVKATHLTQAGASTVDTVNFSRRGSNLLLTNRGQSDIYWCWASEGGTAATPTVGGDDCYILPVGMQIGYDMDAGTVAQIKLIAVAAMSYSAEVY